MPADAQRDANIERLFNKLESINETVNFTKSEVGVIGARIEDFSIRLKRLEEREDMHLAREEKLELLSVKREGAIEACRRENESISLHLSELADKVEIMDNEISKIKNRWIGIVTGLGFAAGFLGYLFDEVVQYFINKGG